MMKKYSLLAGLNTTLLISWHSGLLFGPPCILNLIIECHTSSNFDKYSRNTALLEERTPFDFW